MLYLILKRFSICILALSLSIGMLTGCSVRIPDSKFEKGNWVQQIGCFGISSPIVASSKTDTFPIDNVSFEFYYAFHKEDRSYGFLSTDYKHMVYGLYICETDEFGKLDSVFTEYGMSFDDYKSIPYHTYIHSITEDELLSGKYSYRLAPNKEFIYNHSESITIPKSTFKSNEGVFSIEIIFYCFNDEFSGYICSDVLSLDFSYEKINDNTVKLDFEKNKIYVPF